jgi:hypothetical protein
LSFDKIRISLYRAAIHIIMSQLIEISNRFRELQEKYKEYLPKVDPALINDLLLHQMENPSVTPLYMVEIFTKQEQISNRVE